jgi:SWIM zinc finger
MSKQSIHVTYVFWCSQLGSFKEPKAYVVDIAIPTCQCHTFQQTGKLCMHLIAGRLQHGNGPVESWKGASPHSHEVAYADAHVDLEHKTQRRDPLKRIKGQCTEPKQTADEYRQRDL